MPDKNAPLHRLWRGANSVSRLVLLALTVPAARRQQRRQLDERAHAEAGRALIPLGVLVVARVNARDIKVRPGRIADEVADDLRRRDRASGATTDLLHIGNLATDH